MNKGLKPLHEPRIKDKVTHQIKTQTSPKEKKPFITFSKPHIMYPVGQQYILSCVTLLFLN